MTRASWTAKEQLRLACVVVALAVAGVVLTDAIASKAKCEADGGVWLRELWAWDGFAWTGFKCYDAGTLKVLP